MGHDLGGRHMDLNSDCVTKLLCDLEFSHLSEVPGSFLLSVEWDTNNSQSLLGFFNDQVG